MKFRNTLNDTDRHFVERMEAFGDVVVGFSLSLLALQLVTPDSDADVFGNPLRYRFAPRPLDTVMLYASDTDISSHRSPCISA